MSIEIENAIQYILSFYGRPYRWGGDDPGAGFDCSGLAVEYLKALGVLRYREDFTALGLSKILRVKTRPMRGDLVFFGDSITDIKHVEIMISGQSCIGASGGGWHIKNADDAWQHNAFIKMRPLRWTGRNPIAVRYPTRKI